MGLKLTFSDEAAEMLLSLALFIEQNWGVKQSEKFLKKAYSVFELTSQQPYMFKEAEHITNVRKGLITKQCSFYYEVRETEIVILFLWDNRQESLI